LRHLICTDPTSMQEHFPVALQSAGDAVIRLEDVHKIYRLGEIDVHALQGISLVVAQGEFVAIMGPSGSGKSTMMNILGCLDRPTQGRYFLDGLDVSEMPRDKLADIRNRHVGFVFQNFNLLARTTAFENVELPMVYSGIPVPERAARTREALATVGLSDREDNLPNQLSGGQQQRVAIARALVNNPSIILADEPTGALDTRTSVEVMEIFQRLNHELDLTIVVVTHEPHIARFAHRCISFRDGRIIGDRPVKNRTTADAILRRLSKERDEDRNSGPDEFWL
jgi:putative ABC transport system ATP-binding protein